MLFKPLLLIVLSVSGVLSQRGWGVTYTPVRICALKGSSVDLRCSYSYPTSYRVQKSFWFIYDWNSKQEGEPEDLSENAEYSHRVKYLGNKNKVSNFRINQLKESDSAIYRFRFLTYNQDGKYTGLPGVSLTVTGLQVKVTENEAQSVTLTCSSTCTLSGRRTFTWYKNGTVVSNQNKYSLNVASTDDTDLYSCATGGVTSPAVNVKCVKVEIISDTVSGGETVELTCRATCTWLGNSFIWYKNEQLLTGDYRFSQSYRNLTFTARSEDTGRYSCAVRGYQHLVSPAVTLSVRCVKIEKTSNKASEGDWVTLTCKITCTHLTGSQTFSWYKNGQFLQNTARKYQNHNYLQFIASSGDAGSYSCAVRGHENLPSPAVTLYPPKSTSVSVSPSGEIVEDSSVTLTCSSDASPPVQSYTWYKNNRAYLLWRGSSYTIKSITLQDAGEYYCQAGNGIGTNISPPKRLDVQYPPKNTSVSVKYKSEIVEGSSVTLTCSSSDANPPVQRYTWYKNNRAVSSETGGPEHSYTIKNITLQDAGEYYCVAENGIGTRRSPPKRLDVQYAPKNTSVSVSPSGEIVEGSSVTLTCSNDANPPVQNYTWFKKNDTGAWQAGSGQSLNFSNFTSWNRGQYYCEAQNRLGAQNASALLVTVQGGQSLIAAAAVGVAAILALVILGVVCVRRRKSINETEGDRQGNKSPIYVNVSGMAMSHTGTQGTDRDDSEVPLYASVQPTNTHNQERLLPSTVQKPLPQCEEGVQYASIQIRPYSAAPRSPAPSVKEDCVFYSTLRKLDM